MKDEHFDFQFVAVQWTNGGYLRVWKVSSVHMFGIYFYRPHAVATLSLEATMTQDITLSQEYVAVMLACFRCVLIRCCLLAVCYFRSQLPVLAMLGVRLIRSDSNFNSLHLRRWRPIGTLDCLICSEHHVAFSALSLLYWRSPLT